MLVYGSIIVCARHNVHFGICIAKDESDDPRLLNTTLSSSRVKLIVTSLINVKLNSSKVIDNSNTSEENGIELIHICFHSTPNMCCEIASPNHQLRYAPPLAIHHLLQIDPTVAPYPVATNPRHCNSQYHTPRLIQ